MMGWRDITLYGADSSFSSEEVYCYPRRYGTDLDPSIMYVEIDNQIFPTEIGLLKQVAALGIVHGTFRGTLKFRCGGLMDAYLRAPVTDDSDIEIIEDDDAIKPREAAAV
jgi:hypothetical protein